MFEGESGSVMSDSLRPHGLNTFLSPGDLPNPGIEPRSPALQANSLPAEPQEKPLVSQPGTKSTPLALEA